MPPVRNPQSTPTLGRAALNYRPLPGWGELPPGWSFVEAVGVATDSRDRVYVFNRGEHPVIVFDADGRFLHSWGEGQFVRPHGIWIGPDDMVYLTDDNGHAVRKFTPDGKLVLTLEPCGRPSDTGVEGNDYRTIRRGAGPFNLPTNLALGRGGEMYVTDGYGNARVHKFSPEGKLLRSWGEPGTGPGQFNLPHGVGVDSGGRVFVADRENSRVQIFSPDGDFLEEWTDVLRPCEVFLDRDDRAFVAELGRFAGLFPFMQRDPQATGGRVSVFDRGGKLLARLGGQWRPWGEGSAAPQPPPRTPLGDFFAPHDIWVDSQGSIYVGEVTMSAGGNKGLVSLDCPSLQKFVRT
jgi:DNA-binding beta-propeller fold protein YncE